MIRALHRWPGLLALVLVTVLALSGAALWTAPTEWSGLIVSASSAAGLLG